MALADGLRDATNEKPAPSHFDAVVIGGSYAGLSAAMQLGRAGRRTCVIDDGKPRNRFSETAHGFFGQDGMPPLAMIAQARAKVAVYPTVTLVEGTVTGAVAEGEGRFRVSLASGESVTAAKLVLAFGIVDVLPELPGLPERWGKTVLHCPYCHGFEFKDQPLGVLNLRASSLHQALMIPDWGPTTFFLDAQPLTDENARAQLARRGVKLEPTKVIALEGKGTELFGVRLADGRLVPVTALYVGPRSRWGNDLACQLGCAIEEGPIGPVIRTDEKNMTSVPGVYAAGDITKVQNSATFASAGGVLAGGALHQALIFEPLAQVRVN